MITKNSIALHCCNYTNGTCLGGMFRMSEGRTTIWLDKELADKPCLLVKNKKCSFFNSYVRQCLDKNAEIKLEILEKKEKDVLPK